MGHTDIPTNEENIAFLNQYKSWECNTRAFLKLLLINKNSTGGY